MKMLKVKVPDTGTSVDVLIGMGDDRRDGAAPLELPP